MYSVCIQNTTFLSIPCLDDMVKLYVKKKFYLKYGKLVLGQNLRSFTAQLDELHEEFWRDSKPKKTMTICHAAATAHPHLCLLICFSIPYVVLKPVLEREHSQGVS